VALPVRVGGTRFALGDGKDVELRGGVRRLRALPVDRQQQRATSRATGDATVRGALHYYSAKQDA